MTQISGFWTTEDSTPAGDQVSGYTQTQLSLAMQIIAACSGKEGVAREYDDELEVTANGANTVAVGKGSGVSDGKWYNNDASLNVNIPSAVGVGNTRIDRIVLRASWSTTFTVRVTRIAGVDSTDPSVPAIT